MTVKELRKELFKRNIKRVKEFFSLTDSEFNSIFIDGEPDGCLHGRLLRADTVVHIMICRNGHPPEFFVPKDKRKEAFLNNVYNDVYENERK